MADGTVRARQAFAEGASRPHGSPGRTAAAGAPRLRPGAHLQPRHLRPRASAPLPRHRQRARGRGPGRLGADPFRLAGDRLLRVRLGRRLRARAGRHQAAGRGVPQPQSQRPHRRGRRACARPSSCGPRRPSGRTCSSSTRSRPAFAARSWPPWSGCAPKAAAWCSGSATSWTSRRCSCPNGSARGRRRRCGATTTRSGSTASARSTSPSPRSAFRTRSAARTTYTGYLRRELPQASPFTRDPKITRQPFVLVTTGGGGDGEDLIDWVISAYETERRPGAAGADRLRPFRQSGPPPRLPGADRAATPSSTPSPSTPRSSA